MAAAAEQAAGNVQTVAASSEELAASVREMSGRVTGTTSSQLLSLSEGLSKQAGDLRHEVESFVTQLRAA